EFLSPRNHGRLRAAFFYGLLLILVNSIISEISEIEVTKHGAFSANRTFRAAFRRNGQPVGGEPHGGTDLCPAVPGAAAPARRRHRRGAGLFALEREHGPERIAVVAPGEAGAPGGRPARLLRNARR